jgi:hypothetical protein
MTLFFPKKKEFYGNVFAEREREKHTLADTSQSIKLYGKPQLFCLSLQFWLLCFISFFTTSIAECFQE